MENHSLENLGIFIHPSQWSLKERGGRRPGVDAPMLTAERELLKVK